MIELYKVRKISLSLFDPSSHDKHLSITCEFGQLVDKEGIIYFETHVFDEETFLQIFNNEYLGCHASANMFSFEDIEIEAPNMALTEISTKEGLLTFKCLDYITVYEEDTYCDYCRMKGKEINLQQLLKIDFWGLDLLIPRNSKTCLMVSDAPFDVQFFKDEKVGFMHASFDTNLDVVHNTLTLELFDEFRYSLVGYLSLINGARIQITKEYYNGFSRIYSYNRIENNDCSYYACSNAKVYRPSAILYEFDNYVRWNNLLNLNKLVHHLSTAQQVFYVEDRSFILILAFEGICRKYLECQKKENIPNKVINDDLFEPLSKGLQDELYRHSNISAKDIDKFKSGIEKLNDVGVATYKFRLLLNDLNIEQTKEIKNLIKRVRSTLVHEAELKEYTDYILLSELLREVVLRLINSSVERYSYFDEPKIKGKAPNQSYPEFIKNKELDVVDTSIFSEEDTRIKTRMRCGHSQNGDKLERGKS